MCRVARFSWVFWDYGNSRVLSLGYSRVREYVFGVSGRRCFRYFGLLGFWVVWWASTDSQGFWYVEGLEPVWCWEVLGESSKAVVRYLRLFAEGFGIVQVAGFRGFRCV